MGFLGKEAMERIVKLLHNVFGFYEGNLLCVADYLPFIDACNAEGGSMNAEDIESREIDAIEKALATLRRLKEATNLDFYDEAADIEKLLSDFDAFEKHLQDLFLEFRNALKDVKSLVEEAIDKEKDDSLKESLRGFLYVVEELTSEDQTRALCDRNLGAINFYEKIQQMKIEVFDSCFDRVANHKLGIMDSVRQSLNALEIKIFLVPENEKKTKYLHDIRQCHEDIDKALGILERTRSAGIKSISNNEGILTTLEHAKDVIGKVSLGDIEKRIESLKKDVIELVKELGEVASLQRLNSGKNALNTKIATFHIPSHFYKHNKKKPVGTEKSIHAGKPIEELYILLIIVLCIHILVYYVFSDCFYAQKLWSTALYMLVMGGCTLWLAWIMRKIWGGAITEKVLIKVLGGAIYMIPVTINIFSTAIESEICLEMIGIGGMLMYAQDLILNGMTWKQMCVVGTGNIILAIGCVCKALGMLERGKHGPAYLEGGIIIIFVILVGILCYCRSIRKGEKIGGTLGNVMFILAMSILTMIAGVALDWKSNEYCKQTVQRDA
ncbi:hypothetical protein EHEL_091100 [Encephalitozoon hellem ATCC 50504]|uniref:DUF1686 domain-containing protein n=1 Tax=Encephalitozoon hellem TaxID=27973 RepID=A0A9Q9C4I0_ENCHE|nr:uncharacterized protein EHEL_091100 [Encephalitozoon hellem ATCC 50504]AFM99005.1 hypothetical protein EHEL_091100 [Encephalitozoon hellem ATCC 50504]UTX44021.1 DUF1686 domain-containing protein [Encephalitozoon hellem]|eukprot:XP_003887986.1 hypothetical protein EHEL_091100 [Encephalitozoon hellem ATCC 50504]